jgi:hypothetical protein
MLDASDGEVYAIMAQAAAAALMILVSVLPSAR